MTNSIELRPSYWASVSGGKDSLFMLKLILQHPDQYPLDGVAHFELEIDYPFIRDVINYMKNECEKHGIKFVSIKPSKSFHELYEKRGFPSRQNRWCNKEYKLDAQRQLERFLRQQGAYCVWYVGFCADEISRFRFNLGERDRKVTQIYPIAEMGINEDFILEWAKTVPIFNNFYKFNKRCGCMFCPLQSLAESAYLLKFYPEKFEELKSLVVPHEKQMSDKLGRQFAAFQTNGKYNFEYREKRIREKYLPLLEQKLKEGDIIDN